MPDAGCLTVETRNADLDAEYALTHAPARPGSYVTHVVTGTAAGMDAPTQARIFEPFSCFTYALEVPSRSAEGQRHRLAGVIPAASRHCRWFVRMRVIECTRVSPRDSWVLPGDRVS